MYLGRVIGTVVATRKAAGLDGVPFLAVEPLDDLGTSSGPVQIAADATRQAGPKDLVYLVGSREAALSLEETFVPVDAAIIGIVDEVSRDPTAEPAPAEPATTQAPATKANKGKRAK